MDSHEAPTSGNSDHRTRNLKIEEHGTLFRRRAKPKIRLIGYWLERAGFRPGKRVLVVCLAPGVIELRSADPMAADSGTMQVGGTQP